MTFGFHEAGKVWCPVDTTLPAMPAIELPCVGTIQSLHRSPKRPFLHRDQEVVVSAHQTDGVADELAFANPLSDLPESGLAIEPVREEWHSGDCVVRHVIEASDLNAGAACHSSNFAVRSRRAKAAPLFFDLFVTLL